jgi:hypothetical protein
MARSMGICLDKGEVVEPDRGDEPGTGETVVKWHLVGFRGQIGESCTSRSTMEWMSGWLDLRSVPTRRLRACQRDRLERSSGVASQCTEL